MGLGLGDFLLVLFFFGYLYWLVTPRLEEPELLAECLEEARLAQEVSQRYADDPDMNGYLSPTFYPFWGQFPIIQEREETPIEIKVREWAKYSSSWSDKEWNLESLRRDPHYLELKLWFDELAEELCRELEKPCFVIPNSHRSSRTTGSHRSIFLIAGLQALSEFEKSVGNRERAFRMAFGAVLLGLRLKSTDGHRGLLGSGMFLRALNLFEDLVDFQDLTASQYAKVVSCCLPAESPAVRLLQHLKTAMANTWLESFDNSPIMDLERSKGIDRAREVFGKVTWKIFGLGWRERRFAFNGYTRLVRNWQSQRLDDLPYLRWSVIGDLLIPRGQHLETLSHLCLRSQSGRLGLGVSAALLAHRLSHGDFPFDLRVLPHEVDPELFEWNPQSGELLVLVPPNLPAGVWKPQPEPESWIEATTKGLLFRLSPI